MTGYPKIVSKLYRYGGLVVRVIREIPAPGLPAIERGVKPVLIKTPAGTRFAVARGNAFPRAGKSIAPLPKRYRRAIAEQAKREDDAARKERLAEQGVEVVEAKPVSVGVPSVAWGSA